MTLREKQLALLRRWAGQARREVFTVPGRPELLYYGDGTNGWGVQTNQKAFAALAALSAAEGGAPEYRDTALGMLRYSLETHLTGSFHVTNGRDQQWGHTWISILGVERMMYGVEALWEHLTEQDKTMLRAMLLSEADWQLTETVVADISNETGHNKPESNLWNGALLLRVAAMYPDAPHRAAYVAKGRSFLLNAISVPSDAESSAEYGGIPMNLWFRGANFGENLALDHHGYMNVGYMVITLSQVAMLHFSLAHLGAEREPALYHNAERLWQLVRALLFDDARLWRVGGDTRVRYCYCQDYLLPVLNLAQDCFGQDTEELESRWADLVKLEMDDNGDDSFLSGRCELFRERSPLYYTRLESDRADALGFSLYYRQLFQNYAEPHGTGAYLPDETCQEPLTSWHDAFHGTCFVRGAKRFASFNWRGADGPQGICVPPEDSSLAEWRFNLVGETAGDGITDTTRVLCHRETMFPGGFATVGRFVWHTSEMLAEQLAEEDTVESRLMFAALPDEATVITLQLGRAVKTCHVQAVKPLGLKLPNDVFNGYEREYAMDGEKRLLAVDRKLTAAVIYGGGLELYRPDWRQIGLNNSTNTPKFAPYARRGFLHCDELLLSPESEPHFLMAGETVYDFGAVVVTGDVTEVDARMLPTEGDVRACLVTGRDGRRYLAAANLGDATATLEACSLREMLEPLSAVVRLLD